MPDRKSQWNTAASTSTSMELGPADAEFDLIY